MVHQVHQVLSVTLGHLVTRVSVVPQDTQGLRATPDRLVLRVQPGREAMWDLLEAQDQQDRQAQQVQKAMLAHKVHRDRRVRLDQLELQVLVVR
jgi:hypothetical protein